MKRIILFSLLASVGLLVTACHEYNMEFRCKKGAAYCMNGDKNCYVCKDGITWTHCTGHVIDGQCVEVSVECDDDDDCGYEERCSEDGRCVINSCTDDTDCPDNYFCRVYGNYRICQFDTCYVNSDCNEGYICRNGICEKKFRCENNGQCNGGLVCRTDGQCASEFFTTVWSTELREKLYKQQIPMKILTTNEDCSHLKICWDWQENGHDEFETVTCEEVTDHPFLTSGYKVITKEYPSSEEGEVPDAEKELVIKIEGALDGFLVYRDSNELEHIGDYAPNLVAVRSFGQVGLAKEAFRGCTNLKSVSTVDVPDAAKLKNASGMFRDCSAFNSSLNTWDVSNVDDMSYMFANATTFNQSLDTWNVSKVTNMSYMFNGASLFNQDLSEWYPEVVKSADDMFIGTNINKSNACSIFINWGENSSYFGIVDIEELFGKKYECESSDMGY